MSTSSSQVKKSIKLKVLAGIILGVAVGLALFSLVILAADIGTYIHDTKQIPTLSEFYDAYEPQNEATVFFIGNSMVGFSVYPPQINSLLADAGYNVSTYNLQMSGARYNEYALQLDRIIQTKPDLIIIGTTYIAFSEEINTFGVERFKLFYDESDINENLRRLYTDTELTVITSTSGYKDYKTYLPNAVRYRWGIGDYYTNDYFNDPIGYAYRMKFDQARSSDEQIRNDVTTYPEWHKFVNTSSDPDVVALNYISSYLQNAGIPVVYVSLPLHPLHAEKVTDTDKQAYHTYLNSTGYPWYDFENECSALLFRDHGHVTFEGAQFLAPKYVDMIIQELS